jgi:hypothetical protein
MRQVERQILNPKHKILKKSKIQMSKVPNNNFKTNENSIV